MPIPGGLPPLNLSGGNAGPIRSSDQNIVNFSTGAFGPGAASNTTLIFVIGGVAGLGLILWLVLR